MADFKITTERRRELNRASYRKRMQDQDYRERRKVYNREQMRALRGTDPQCRRSRWAALSLRFWTLVDKSDGCWLWKGTFNKGYGQIQVRGKFCRAHRVAYELTHGVTLSPEQILCHHCDNAACVRPDHMFIGTHADNVADMIQKGRHRGGWGSRQSYRTRTGTNG